MAAGIREYLDIGGFTAAAYRIQVVGLEQNSLYLFLCSWEAKYLGLSWEISLPVWNFDSTSDFD